MYALVTRSAGGRVIDAVTVDELLQTDCRVVLLGLCPHSLSARRILNRLKISPATRNRDVQCRFQLVQFCVPEGDL